MNCVCAICGKKEVAVIAQQHPDGETFEWIFCCAKHGGRYEGKNA
jgi:hypothetical protein